MFFNFTFIFTKNQLFDKNSYLILKIINNVNYLHLYKNI